MGDEVRDLQLQISEERRAQDQENAKRDERMSVLEAKFEAVRSSNKLMVGTFASLTAGVVLVGVGIILKLGGG
ncbi:MAG TPA: hypothetical protein VF009_11370 [Solirubrobacterales bacterium]